MTMAATQALPPTTLPAAQPTYIFRGHASAVQALIFFRNNSALASADADGYVVVWSVAIKRPVAVWRAHEASILGIEIWGNERLITQGRDSKLLVWDVSSLFESSSEFSLVLPTENHAEHRRLPWLLHTLDVTTLNFCSFASCAYKPTKQGTEDDDTSEALLIAVSGSTDSEIELYQLPDQTKKGLITAPQDNGGKAAGMVMALKMFTDASGVLTIISAYENGQNCVFKRVVDAMTWQQTYSNKLHTQPILSLDVAPALDFYFTSGADSIVVKHALAEGKFVKDVQTKHSGQQGLHVRSDGRIFATAGWDHKGRVYSAKSLKELAVLQWHKESCYSIAFAAVADQNSQVATSTAVVSASPKIAQAREAKVQATHWLALGSKDGKVSLWDIY